MKPRRACELCNGEAALHCESDSAYLCWACDARVHGANFLVARHPRRVLCLECGAADPRRLPVSGPGFLPASFRCRSCGAAEQGDDGAGGVSDSDSDSEWSSCCSSSAPSSCVSSAESGAAAGGSARGTAIASVPACSATSAAAESSDCSKRGRTRGRRRRGTAAARRDVDARTEDVLLNWCRRIGLGDSCAPAVASHALGVGAGRMAAAPFRVVAAAAVWFAARLCCAEAAEGARPGVALLRRLEACSGVPAKLIAVAGARLSRAVRRRHVGEEGWAECP